MLIFKRTLSLLGLATVAATLMACAGAKPITAERPRDEAFRTELKKELSSLNVPLEASCAELARTLNLMVGKELYKGSTKYSGVTADIVRNGQMGVSAADDYLYLTVPITMTLRYGMFAAPPISSTLKFKLNVKVTPDWKLNIEIYYLGLSDLLAEDLRIGLLTLKPRTLVEGITQPVQKALSELLSRVINAKYPLKPQIDKAWSAAQKPVLVDKNYSAWLKITPREVLLYPLFARNNQVKLNLGLTTFAELVVGPQPATPPPVPLPNLKLVTTLDRNFRISLHADLFYRDIVAIAAPLLLNREFVSDGKSIVLKEFDVYGNGDKLVIKVATTGSLDGVVYLTGKPLFDPQTNMLSVADVDFDMNTQDLLLQSAGWLLHGSIKSAIQEKLVLDMTPRLEEARALAQKAITLVKLADNIYLKGNIKAVKFNDLLVQKDRISIVVYTEGETAIAFQ